LLMLFFPRASMRAIKRGLGERNLYRVDFDAALSGSYDAARLYSLGHGHGA
jgi:hypothetical protein